MKPTPNTLRPMGTRTLCPVIIFLSGLFCHLLGAETPTVSKAEPGKKSIPHDDIFAKLEVLKIRVDIPREGIAALRRSPRGFGFGESADRPVVKCTVREGGRVYTNVAIHLKGAAGSFRPIDDNPALTLNFEKFAPGQTFHGLHKFSLNNSVQDPSFLSERICRELFEAAGVPVPRAAHAVLDLNGANLGLRVLTEGYGKHFLKRYFKNTSGNLYDGGFCKEINDDLAVNSGDHPDNHSDLKKLAAAAMEPDPSRRTAALEKILDMDRFISMIAMEVIQCHWDGYAMNRNNYRLYHDLDSDRMVFMPHGLDQMFGVERSGPNSPIFPQMQGLVARAVIRTPEGRRRYQERMSQLVTNVFKVETILKRVDELAGAIRPAIAESNPRYAQSIDQQIAWLKQRISQRGQSLRLQLSAPSKVLKFDSSGLSRLVDWKAKTDTGNPTFAEKVAKDGRTAMRISVGSGASASWRTRAVLDAGRYRFEGFIRLQEVAADPRDARGGGVCLRVSRAAMPKKLTGTTEWSRVAYEFEVEEAGTEVEFVCELRARSGDAWFDADSLRLIRE
ncbi:MAG: CotH kinase family protein [Verrucomicrobia bacterium]|nr:CotH kinase family protein [Verrucomicrobiota bacterium]